MIGLMPRYVARTLLRKPTRAYTPLRRSRRPRKKHAKSAVPVNNEIVLFDHGPTEFPVATARPTELRARAIALAADLQRWLAARWAWFKPRSVPCAVAGLGMIAVLASADYLAHHQDDSAKPAPTNIVRVDLVPR